MQIRDGTQADLPALTAIRNTPVQYEEYLSQADGVEIRFLVCQRDRRLLAFAMLYMRQPAREPAFVRLDTDLPRINDLYVAKDLRSHGIGSAFLAYLEKLAFAAGHTAMYLSVDPVRNPRAAALYRRLGYRPTHDGSYRKTALWYDEGGNPHEIEYWRMDMIKELGSGKQPGV